MPAKESGYKSISVKNQTYENILRLAKIEFRTVPKFLENRYGD